MTICYVCGKDAVQAYGYSESKILLISDIPEAKSVRPFDDDASKRILRRELAECGLDIASCRLTNLWIHIPNKKDKLHYDDCYKASLTACLDEAKGRQAILLVGGTVTSTFTDYSIVDVNGLQVDSNMLSAPIIYSCVKPATVYAKGVGELRFALKNFTNHLKKENLL